MSKVGYCANQFDECKELVIKYTRGKNINQLSEYCSRHCSCRWSPRVRQACATMSVKPKEFSEFLYKLVEEKSLKSAACLLRVSPATITRWIKKYGKK